MGGENRWQAVLGTSGHCIATHASDLAVALVALDAAVEISLPGGQRTVALVDFTSAARRHPAHRHRARTWRSDRRHHGAQPVARRSHYRKVPDRASFEFALVSAVVALELDGVCIRQALVALGGVCTKPGEHSRSRQPWLEPMSSRRCSTLLQPAPRMAHEAAGTTTSRSNSCSASSCAPCKPRELAHGHRVYRTPGQPRRRRLKVTGGATYAAEFTVPGQAYGAPVRRTVANGRIASIDAVAAERAPGVLAVLVSQCPEARISRAPWFRRSGGR
jgi:hypothetical protein